MQYFRLEATSTSAAAFAQQGKFNIVFLVYEIFKVDSKTKVKLLSVFS